MAKSTGLEAARGLYCKRGWFYFQPPTPKGGGPRPKARALKTQDLMDALQRMDELSFKVEAEAAATAGTLKEWLPRYYADKKDDAVSTRRARKVILEQFKNDVGNPRPDQITAAMVDEWRSSLLKREKKNGRHLSGTTIKSYTITLRAFVNWLREEKVIRHDPMTKLKKMTRVAATKRHEFLTEAQREKLLADGKASEHVRLILHLGFLAGLRDAEMLAMTPAWIWISPDQQRGTITVQETAMKHDDGTTFLWRPKTREIRTIPMHPRLLSLVLKHGLKWPFMVMPEKEFWPTEKKNSKRYDARKALQTLAKRNGIPKLNFHMMRHSFATHLAMKGVPLAEIAGLLGDSLKVTEDHYAGFCPNKANPLEVL